MVEGKEQEDTCSVIRINVGGVHYETLRTTLLAEDSMLSSMFGGKHKLLRDKDGCPFIDRPGVPFGFILNFLRDRTMMPPKEFMMQVHQEASYYQIASLIKKLETTPEIFRLRLRENTKTMFKNFDSLKETLILHAQAKSQKTLKMTSTISFMTSSYKKKLEDPVECVLTDHLLSLHSEGPCRQEKYTEFKHRLQMLDIVIDDEKADFDIAVFMDLLDKDLHNDGYQCKLWSEKWKCLYRSNYTRKECPFHIVTHFVEMNWA
ncbi:BTB/POZ domain-containing protein KCTD7-like isoform X2 [Xenia sp. Carnegie-2017]|uniref:BTB/POZ domain-containing protein KCTD7-like isoform X2 n=1 Tax=Xenia sp. Carnegie-2017 TaxID=2897299 RepID=UPI001F03DA55|nr:BTB/POZ domain-containing protein KCTD7-like isoform X2 [Xenia sp. Carnegie-2017]